ncbi:MAG TPA: PAS domain S-box protein, partial [Candidatus Methanoperedens sp.]|nr:PAS domain S-box protein [Candidatus Methanoperedens sp.]
MKVMIVDDNKFDRMMLSKMLAYNKYDAVEAGNGIEALKLISKEKPDIVVSDIMMPEMDGFSLLREIRKSKSAKELPFVFYSASYVNEKDRELANALGVSRFIIKPVEPKDLIKEITQILLDFSNGKLEIIEPTLKDDEYLEQYSRRIFKKLQEKVIQLEQEIDERKRIEEELLKSEAQFRATFEEAPIGMARLDIEGRNLETNHILQQMLGFAGEELKGKVFTEFTHPDDLELDMGEFMKLISGKKDHYMIKKRYIRKKGSVFWARMTVSLVRDANGAPQFSISMVEDITERKEAEEKLQKSEEKYRTLIENIQDGVFVIQDGEIQYINEFFSRLAGYEVEEVIGKDFVEFIAPEDRIRIADYYIRWEGGEKVPRENEFNIIHKDKKTRITVNANIGFINYRGKVASMGTLKDITERKRAQEDLRIKAQLLDSASDFIYVH